MVELHQLPSVVLHYGKGEPFESATDRPNLLPGLELRRRAFASILARFGLAAILNGFRQCCFHLAQRGKALLRHWPEAAVWFEHLKPGVVPKHHPSKRTIPYAVWQARRIGQPQQLGHK